MTKPQTSENANAPAVARRALEKASASVVAGASDSLMPWATSARYLMHTNSMTRETTRTTVRSPYESMPACEARKNVATSTTYERAIITSEKRGR